MEKKIQQIAKRLHDSEGNWMGSKDKMVTINGEKHNFDDLAKQYNIDLPKASKPKAKVNKVEEERHADMGQTHTEGHTDKS